METTFAGMYKTNFDSAVFEELGEVGIGVLIQNFRGEVMASLAEKSGSLPRCKLLNFLQLGRWSYWYRSLVLKTPFSKVTLK